MKGAAAGQLRRDEEREWSRPSTPVEPPADHPAVAHHRERVDAREVAFHGPNAVARAGVPELQSLW